MDRFSCIMLHSFCSLFTVKDPIERINNSVIRQTPEGIIKYITSVNGINESTIKRIVDYITYDSSKKTWILCISH